MSFCIVKRFIVLFMNLLKSRNSYKNNTHASFYRQTTLKYVLFIFLVPFLALPLLYFSNLRVLTFCLNLVHYLSLGFQGIKIENIENSRKKKE